MTAPLVSVVIPVRNRSRLLERTLRSLEEQRFRDFEVVVVDDGSDEPIRHVIEASGLHRVRLLERNAQGAASARNAGAEAATGQWLVFLDSDDEADETWLATMTNLASEGDASIVFCGARHVLDGAVVGVSEPSQNGVIAGGPSSSLFLAGAFMLNRQFFLELGGYDVTLPASQHTDLRYRVLAIASTRQLRSASTVDAHLTFHLHDAGNIRSDHKAVIAGALAMIEKHQALLKTSPSTLADYWAVAGVNTVRVSGDVSIARRYLWRAVREEPRRTRHWNRLLLSLISPLARRKWKSG